MNIPNDAAMLLSFVNLKLRDHYKSLDDFCLDAGISKEEIIKVLQSCNHTERFIYTASDYQVFNAVNECYQFYNMSKK